MTDLDPQPAPDPQLQPSFTSADVDADPNAFPSPSPDPASSPARPRRRWVRRLLGCLFVLFVLLAAGVGWVYWASRQVPDFYEAAARQSDPIPPETLRKTAARVTRETQDVLKRESEDKRPWDFEITPGELNAWLVEELPGLTGGEWPKELAEPRVAFEEGRVLVGAMVSIPGWEGVASLSLLPSLQAPRTLLLEIESLKIGKVPVPIDRLITEVPELAESPYLQKSSKSGKPVLRVPLDMKEARSLQLETLEVTPARLRVTGR